MNKFEIGTKVIVVGPDLTGWTGIVSMHYKHDLDACSVDLDPEQDPETDLTGCYFEYAELEAV